ncbi:MAG: hypothetical protein IJ881_08480, partial [Neisseriaceae bacterium]|nr:hypothetical protein [Neisseriaceae bacterium]
FAVALNTVASHTSIDFQVKSPELTKFDRVMKDINEMPPDDIQIFGRKNTAPIVSQAEGNARLEAIRQKLAGKMKS